MKQSMFYYSANFGSKDEIRDISHISKTIPCYLFTDQELPRSYKGWLTFGHPRSTAHSPRYRAKIVKLMPHLLPFSYMYNYCVWMDSSVIPKTVDIVERMVKKCEKFDLVVLESFQKHKKNLEDEMNDVLQQGLETRGNVKNVQRKIEECNLDYDWLGNYGCTALVFDLKSCEMRTFTELWWWLSRYTLRDQIVLSIAYRFSRKKFKLGEFDYSIWRKNVDMYPHLIKSTNKT